MSGLVFILDDDSLMRKSLGRLLRNAGYQVEDFATGDDLLNSTQPQEPACLILDVQMPGRTGIEIQEELARRHWDFSIIFVTAHGTVPMSVKAIKSGAVDFLTKPLDDTRVLHAVSVALESARERRRSEAERQELQMRLHHLTSREHEVLRWLLAGRLNKQIAGVLGTTERTIKAHRKNIMEKMAVASVAELVWIAEKTGLKAADAE